MRVYSRASLSLSRYHCIGAKARAPPPLHLSPETTLTGEPEASDAVPKYYVCTLPPAHPLISYSLLQTEKEEIYKRE